MSSALLGMLATLLLLLCANDLVAHGGTFVNYCLGVGALGCAFAAGVLL